MCEYKNEDCPGGAHAFALHEDGIRTVEDYIEKCVKPAVPAVPDKVAPTCIDGSKHHVWQSGKCICCQAIQPAEPQAGAQVPSQSAYMRRKSMTTEDELKEAYSQLDTIRSYVLEAAKTPISREDMHDAMKAQTYYDETNGLYRLILSEIGDGK